MYRDFKAHNCLALLLAVLQTLLSVSPARAASNAPGVNLTPDQQAIIAKITKPTETTNVKFETAPVDAIGLEVSLPFRDGRSVTLVRRNSSFRPDGSISWNGEVKETGERAVLMLWGNALLTGYFAYQGTIFAIETIGGGMNVIRELGRDELLPDHPAPASRHDSVGVAPDPAKIGAHWTAPLEPRVAPFPEAERRALEAKNITIDVMLLYTPNVAYAYTRDAEDLLALAIDETNTTFRNSGLGNITLRLVYSQAVNYDTTSDDQFTHLYTMVDGLGPFADVKRLRNEKRADIVGLIIDNPKGCGLSTRVGPDSDEAFFVVHHACATITLSIAHEIGHILGVRHDRFMDQASKPFVYGHGYVNGRKWRDIMSYNEGCGGCPRIPYWSNPRISFNGEPTGTPASDSARVILELAERVSKFR
jgi:hypothetical protein